MSHRSLRPAVAAATLLLLAVPLNAQRTTPAAIDRGSIVIDGSASISRSRFGADGGDSDSKITSTQISLVPSLLYFVAPRLAVGGSIQFARFRSDGSGSTTVGAGPTARLYFAGQSATVLPYMGASTRVARISVEAPNGSPPPASTQWAVEGVAGLTWLFSPQVGILTEAFARRLSYDGGSVNGSVDYSTTDLGVRLGVAAFISRGR